MINPLQHAAPLLKPERHPKRRPSISIAGDPDDAARNLSLELVARSKESGVRSAVSEGNSHPLRVAHHDVRAPLTRGNQKRERKEIGSDRDERACCVCAIAELAIVNDGAVGCRVLEQDAENVISDLD